MSSVAGSLKETTWAGGRGQWLLVALVAILCYPRLEAAARLNAGSACFVKALSVGVPLQQCGAVLQGVADDYPDQYRPRAQLGAVHYHSGEFEKSLLVLRTLPGDAVTGLYIGLSEEALGRPGMAIDAWRKVGAGQYYFSHGEAARSTGDSRLAVGQYERTLAIDPGFEPARLAVAEVYARSGEYEKIEEVLDSTVTTARGHTLLGIARYQQLQMSSAREAFLRARRIEPLNYASHWFLGMIYWHWERWGDALSEFEAIKPPAGEIVLGARGQPFWAAAAMYEKLGQIDVALGTYLDGIANDPAYYPNYLGAGQIHVRAGRLDSSAALYQKLLRLEPGNAAVLEALASLETPGKQ